MKKINSKNSKLTAVDFFCGAGGFSEGFRQQGFEILMGVDYWKPAIDSHNLNHLLNDKPKNILDFWGKNSIDTNDIDTIPNSTIIIGSPSCVSFSMSNKAGKADKSLGIKLIKSFLRVVAVKKHQSKSSLLAWYLENVPQSKFFIKEKYSFNELNLHDWAIKNKIAPGSVALHVNGEILNAADYGASQNRKRFVAGEWVPEEKFLPPEKTTEQHVTTKIIRSKLPNPTSSKTSKIFYDPNYPWLECSADKLTDHFYDTGLYKIEWEKAAHLKTNHPYMGKMSFPEDEDRSCRTIMATRSASTREAIIYKSEWNREGNGEYRLPTVREIACLMGYPVTYQFVGSESVKWKQVGNSVSPHLSAALAKSVRKKIGMNLISEPKFATLKNNYTKVNNLNTWQPKFFDYPKQRSPKAKFRRHPIKLGNMTIDLQNYSPRNQLKVGLDWYVFSYFGAGNLHKVKQLSIDDIEHFEKILLDRKDIVRSVNVSFPIISNMQKLYENDLNIEDIDNPINRVKRLGKLIEGFSDIDYLIDTGKLFPKKVVPLAQIIAAYGLLVISKSN